MSAPPQKIHRPRFASLKAIPSGFTLLELLVTLAILAALLSLSLIGAGSFIQRSREGKCQNNLRQIGAAFFTFAADHNNRLHLFSYKDAGSSVTWLNYLSGYVSAEHGRSSQQVGSVYLPLSDIVVCPGFSPKRYDPDSRNHIYGSRARDPNDPAGFSPPGLASNSAGVNLSSVTHPGSYWLLADSYHRDKQSQIYIVQNTKASAAGMHFRHRDRAYVLYADGHVAAETFETMSALSVNPVQCAYDAAGNSL